jgi:hypothetical protein
LTVNGSDFVSGATVYWNSISRVTNFVSSTQLTATILASDLAAGGSSASVTVQNPSPSAGISNVEAFSFENPAPIVASVTPSSALAGSTLTVNITGSGFINGATVQLGGQNFNASVASSTSLTAQIAPQSVGALPLVVSNPAPTAGPSNSVSFTGTAAGPGVTPTLVSIGTSGNVGGFGTMSANARYVAFSNDLRDTCFNGPTGCIPSTIQFANAGGFSQSGGFNLGQVVTNDGKYLASLISGYPSILYGPGDLEFVTTCIGVSSGCTTDDSLLLLDAVTRVTGITQDGRYITFEDAMPGNQATDAIEDACTGAPPNCTPSTINISSSAQSAAEASADARYAVFAQPQSISIMTGPSEIVLHDTCLGAAPGCAPSDNVESDLTKSCTDPVISGDAQFIAYSCGEVFIQNTCIGAAGSCTPTASQVTSSNSGLGQTSGSSADGLSAGGRFIVYETPEPTIAGQTLSNPMVFVYDTCNGASGQCTPRNAPVCLNSQGAVANQGCSGAQISDDGAYILFNSGSTNLDTRTNSINGELIETSYIVPNPLM